MSEEILKALMQLFALLTKQDGGVKDKEREYIKLFLERRISPELVQEYLDLFDSFAFDKKKDKEEEGGASNLTSVKDSVKILGICKKINKTLSQKQKIIVLVNLYELIVSDRKFTEQRMAIIDTVAEVFKIEKEENQIIDLFLKYEHFNDLIKSEDSYKNIENAIDFESYNVLGQNSNILTIGPDNLKSDENSKKIITQNLKGIAFILKINSVDLYFFKYIGDENLTLNSQQINSNEVYAFSNGSILRLPKDKPIYYSDVVAKFHKDDNTTELSFNANNISFKFPAGVLGLRNISISEEQGKLIGIMGASGSGKTTLLNVLSGIETPSEGEVLINGINLHTEKDKIKGIIGYVPQDDILIEELTVFENLYYNAKFCFNDLTENEIIEKVHITLKSLGLFEKKDLKVGSPMTNKTISGGQRKRLNIAFELIREPAILYLDEPTSGLSSRDSENIIDLLRELTLNGKLVFVVIHQPSSDIYKMFDKVIILDTGGYLIYYDNPVEAVRYFKTMDMQVDKETGECPKCGNVNPEMIFNIIEKKVVDEYGNYKPERKVSPTVWSGNYLKNNKIEQIEDKKATLPSLLKVPNKIKQFIIYTLRDFYSKVSNKQYLLINLIESPLLAFLLAFIVRYINKNSSDHYIFRLNDNIFPFIFISVIVALFVGMTVSAEEIFRDRKILKRESFLNLSRNSYLMSKVFILFSLSAIQTLLFTIIGNSIMEIQGMYFDYWIVLFTISCVAVMIGLNISSALNSAVTIYILIPLLIIPQMILSGGTFSFDKLNSYIGGGKENPPLMAEAIPARWAFEALVVQQFKENKFEKQFYEINQIISVCNYKSSFYIPKLLSILDNYKEKHNDAKRNKTVFYFPADDIELLKNEIARELKYGESNRYIKFEFIDSLTAKNFNIDISENTREYLLEIKDFYNKTYNAASDNKDIMTENMKDTPEKRKLYTELEDNYYNENLVEIMKNSAAKDKILRFNNTLVQNMDKVYLYPPNDRFIGIRAHFFSPIKFVFGKKINTFTLNIIILWTISIFLYLTLYFDLLKKLLEFKPKFKFIVLLKNKLKKK